MSITFKLQLFTIEQFLKLSLDKTTQEQKKIRKFPIYALVMDQKI